MKRVKAYVDEASNAYVGCWDCGRSKELNFSQRDVPPGCMIKCRCGNTFVVTFEQRQHPRKQLDTFGICFAEANPDKGIHIRISEISLGGLRFENSQGAAFQLNETLRIVFRLDVEFVELIASVRNINDANIGAEILKMEEHSKKIMSLYLLPRQTTH